MSSAHREPAAAIRATAVVERGMFGRHRRKFRYDALFRDGRVSRDVDVSNALVSARYPADSFATTSAAQDTCPEVGPGRWVEYASGRVIDDPIVD